MYIIYIIHMYVYIYVIICICIYIYMIPRSKYRDEETMVEINLIEMNYTNIKIQYSYTGETMGGKFWILYLCREYYKHKKTPQGIYLRLAMYGRRFFCRFSLTIVRWSGLRFGASRAFGAAEGKKYLSQKRWRDVSETAAQATMESSSWNRIWTDIFT